MIWDVDYSDFETQTTCFIQSRSVQLRLLQLVENRTSKPRASSMPSAIPDFSAEHNLLVVIEQWH